MKTDLFLNATAMSRLWTCRRLAQVSCLWGYSEDSSYADWGTMFHKFCEHRSLDKTYDLLAFAKQYKQMDPQFIQAASTYSSLDPLSDGELFTINGKPTVELQFAFPYITTDKYVIHLCGTIDRLDIVDDTIRIIDYKTLRSTKVREVLAAYAMQTQIRFYLWMLKNYILPDDPHIKAGAFYGKYLGVFISFTPAKFEFSEKIVLTADTALDIENLVRQSIAEYIALADNPDLALPTGMSSYQDAKCACDHCWMKNLCITGKHSSIINILKEKESKPYDPRTWR